MEEDIDNGVDIGPEDEEVGMHLFDHPDDGPYDLSEVPAYTPSTSPRTRRIRHSDPVSRGSTSARKVGGSGLERDHRTREVECKNSRKGKVNLFLNESS